MSQRDLSPKGMKDEIVALQGNTLSYMSVSAADEAADAILVTVNIKDYTDDAKEGVQQVLVDVLDATLDPVAPNEFALALGASGASVATSGTVTRTLFTTDADGILKFSVTDAVGGADTNVYVVLSCTTKGVAPVILSLTFDDA